VTALVRNELVAEQSGLTTVLSAAAVLPCHVGNLVQPTVGSFLTSKVTCPAKIPSGQRWTHRDAADVLVRRYATKAEAPKARIKAK
jgi:hypothetical protein